MEGVVAARRPGARLSRSASAERHHHRVEVVEAVGPAPEHRERQVELRRRRAGPPARAAHRVGRGGHRRARPRRCGPSASRRAIHSPDRERLRAPVRRDPDRGERRARRRSGGDRAAGGPARCGASCGARGSRPGPAARARPPRRASSRSSSANGSTTITADSTFGAGSNAPGGTTDATRTRGVVLHEHREVAHLAGRGRDALGDLALDHQHEPLRPGRRAEQRDGGSGS